MLLSELETDSKEISVTHNGKTFKVTYNPSVFTAEFTEKADDMSWWQVLDLLLVDWDLMGKEEDGKGKTKEYKLPLQETLKKMSVPLIVAIYRAIQADIYSPNLVVIPPTRTEDTSSFA